MPDPAPYRTLSAPCGPFELKEKKSKFIGWAFPAASAGEAGDHIASLRSRYADATHVCHAFRIGTDQPVVRMSDDGEPAHSAGAPILHQIEAAGLYNVVVAVVRYYGGTNLGVGGLIRAYREAARGCLEEARVVTRTPHAILTLDFQYPVLGAVMRFISQNRLEIRDQQMELACSVTIRVPLHALPEIRSGIAALGQVQIREETRY